MDLTITNEQLKRIRLAAGLSQTEAAEMVCLGRADRWMEYEKGIKVPESARVQLFLIKLAMARGINFLEFSDNPRWIDRFIELVLINRDVALKNSDSQLMAAEVLLPPDCVRGIADRDVKKSGVTVGVDIQSRNNGEASLVVGRIQQVMFLIGAVAAEGEAALYRAEVI